MNGGDRGETEHFGEALRRRTKAFALDVLEFCRGLPKTDEAMVIGRQLLRSGMAVGANYRAASRARSAAEFVSKISIVVEEADETLYWLETLLEASIATRSRVEALLREGNESLRNFAASQRTAKKSSRRNT